MTTKKLLIEADKNMPLSDTKKLADMFFIHDYYSLSKIFEKNKNQK